MPASPLRRAGTSPIRDRSSTLFRRSRQRFVMLLGRSGAGASPGRIAALFVDHQIDPLPGIASGRPRALPIKRRLAALAVPIAFEIALRFLPVATVVLGTRLPAVL